MVASNLIYIQMTIISLAMTAVICRVIGLCLQRRSNVNQFAAEMPLLNLLPVRSLNDSNRAFQTHNPAIT